ncbi:hypothetical protein PM082_007959 [Marasmius tenuissimus]|nr:hypothetical protein PM082_007959 [Marasmius tenuissimus]
MSGSFYSFHFNEANKKSRAPAPPPTPIPADAFYGTPSARHNITSSTPVSSSSSQVGVPNLSSPPSIPNSPTRKRRHPDQNDSPFVNYTPAKPLQPHKRAKTTEKPAKKPKEIVAEIIKFIKRYKWGLSDFLFWVSDSEDRDMAHAIAMEKFLSGRCTHHPGEIIHKWYKSPDGVLGANIDAQNQMWGTATKYWEVKQVRACLTSFVAQEAVEHAVQQARKAVKPAGGLHVRITVKDTSGSHGHPVKTEWKEIGKTTVPQVKEILVRTQPFLFNLLTSVARGSPQEKERKTRPFDIVVTHALSSLNFCLNRQANWLPVARGLLYFALSAPVDLFAYESRTGTMPVYSTVNTMLSDLGEEEGRATKAAGSDPRGWRKLFVDNTQRNHRQRDERVGRANHMMIGMAGCLVEYPPGTFPETAPSVEDRKARILANDRASVNAEYYLQLINQEHLETVGTLQWMQNSTTHIPELKIYHSQVSLLYKTRAGRTQLNPKPSIIHPLATNSKNETVTTELKEALLDFLEQAGQTKESHQHRLFPIGGNGLTFQKIHELKRQLQSNSNKLESFELVEPQLERWHTQATDVSRIFQTHWGPPLSKDPSTLGHSARKIQRKEPPNLKKVDYYPSVQLMHLVLDARMLDALCSHLQVDDVFVYFTELKSKNKLPTFEELESIARTLYRCYSTSRGIHYALNGASLPEENSAWTRSVPSANSWSMPSSANDPLSAEQGFTNADMPPQLAATAKKSAKTKKKTKAQVEAEKEREEMRRVGDRVLANSIAFMRDALLLREAAYAAASGDVGRFWEVFKVMLFTFFGSGYTKYGHYALEFITTLELESSKEFREASLRMMLINLFGKPGAFSPCDLVQEYFNRLLEFIVERKGKEFDDRFIRRVVARNLHHLTRIKTDL